MRFLTSIVAQTDDTGSFNVCLFYSGFIRCFFGICVGIVSCNRIVSTLMTLIMKEGRDIHDCIEFPDNSLNTMSIRFKCRHDMKLYCS